MHMANINKFMGMVLDELQKSEGKYHKFFDAIIDPTSSKSWAEVEYRIKLRNQRGHEYADHIYEKKWKKKKGG